MEKEPLSCPFCGGKAKKHYKSGDERNGYANTVLYRCESCFVQLGVTGDTSRPGYADNSKIEQRALEKWNQRVAPVMPTAWKFVWNDSGRFFSSLSKQTIELYAKDAFSAHGKNCGRIEPVFDLDPYIVEGKS